MPEPSVRPHRARLSSLALDRVFEAHKDLDAVRQVHAQYVEGCVALLRVARRFETLRENKWSQSVEAMVASLETHARMHILDIAERAGRKP
jgi:hypothetical protein